MPLGATTENPSPFGNIGMAGFLHLVEKSGRSWVLPDCVG